MKATLHANNKKYKVDLNKLIQLGVIGVIEDCDEEIKSDQKIQDFETGDVFENGSVSVLILETSHDLDVERRYQIAGLDGLKVYSDFYTPVNFDTILNFLNNGKFRFIKNINSDIEELIRINS